MDKKVIATEDGSSTIFDPSVNDHYHSRHGAVQESVHVYIKPGLRTIQKNLINVFELGFGTGLNGLLTAIEAEELDIKVRYTGVEKYPLGPAFIESLNYPDFIGSEYSELFSKIHDCQWDNFVPISDNFEILKVKADIRDYLPSGLFDLVYFDAFGPDKQAELWTSEIISKICSACNPGALFLTYSAKGELKRQLKNAGFKVDHIPGPPGKREITRAIKL